MMSQEEPCPDGGTVASGRRRPHAIVIGGGIAGCSLALFLARFAGCRVSVFEAYPRDQALQGIGGGLQLAPNGMRVLHHLGLADRLRSVGVESHAFSVECHDGRTIARVPIGPYDQPAVNATRAALHRVLMDAVAEESPDIITLEFEKRLVDVAGVDSDASSPAYRNRAGDDDGDDDDGDDDGPVVVTFEDGSQARGDLVVGADGVRSRVRALMLGDADPKPESLGIVAMGGFAHSDAFVGRPEHEQGTIHFLFSPSGSKLGYCRAQGDDPRLVMWWRNMLLANHPGLVPAMTKTGVEPTKDELQAIDTDHLKRCILTLPGGDQWPPEVRQMVEDTETLLRGTLSDIRSLPRWWRGRACLLGDAAHAVSPHSGQGASMALEDAMLLGKMLCLALEEHQPHGERSRVPRALLERAFEAFERGRKERVEAIVADARRRGEQPHKRRPDQAPGAIKRWFFGQFMGLVFNYLVPPELHRRFAYRIEWDGIASLAQVEAEQRQAKQRLLSQRSVFFLSALLAVPAAAFLIHSQTK